MDQRKIQEMAATMRGIPEHNREALAQYMLYGVPVGGFLQAVLSNDLMGAMSKADWTNQNAICGITAWLFNHAPVNAYGSPQAMQAWMKQGGIDGRP